MGTRDEGFSPEDVELDQLRRWKAEAMEVLAEWDKLHEALGSPGCLGSSKAASSLEAVGRLISDRDAEAAVARRLNHRVDETLERVERLTANWTDLADRAEIAEANLDQMAEKAGDDPLVVARLKGKASGVALVRDYMRGYHS